MQVSELLGRPVRDTRGIEWRHRGTFLAMRGDVAENGPHETVRIREGFTRYSTVLP